MRETGVHSDSLPPADMRMAVVLFDGVCNFCNRSVAFIAAHDPGAHFFFAALQSDVARRLIALAGSKDNLPDSVALIEDGQIYTHPIAALRILRRLRFPWPLFYVLIVLPKWLRNGVYSWVARHRYGWFGKQDACMVPTPALRSRFLS